MRNFTQEHLFSKKHLRWLLLDVTGWIFEKLATIPLSNTRRLFSFILPLKDLRKRLDTREILKDKKREKLEKMKFQNYCNFKNIRSRIIYYSGTSKNLYFSIGATSNQRSVEKDHCPFSELNLFQKIHTATTVQWPLFVGLVKAFWVIVAKE